MQLKFLCVSSGNLGLSKKFACSEIYFVEFELINFAAELIVFTGTANWHE